MESHEIVKLFAEVSILGAIVYLFVRFTLTRMKDSDEAAERREDRIATRVTHLESFINEKLLSLVQASTEAIGCNTAALDRTCKALEQAEKLATENHDSTQDLLNELKRRPCLTEDE